jgi:hypothetical protein
MSQYLREYNAEAAAFVRWMRGFIAEGGVCPENVDEFERRSQDWQLRLEGILYNAFAGGELPETTYRENVQMLDSSAGHIRDTIGAVRSLARQ